MDYIKAIGDKLITITEEVHGESITSNVMDCIAWVKETSAYWHDNVSHVPADNDPLVWGLINAVYNDYL